MSDDLALPYRNFWYIKLKPDSKLPAEKWGGYGNDPKEAHESVRFEGDPTTRPLCYSCKKEHLKVSS